MNGASANVERGEQRGPRECSRIVCAEKEYVREPVPLCEIVPAVMHDILAQASQRQRQSA